jgi:ubiquinone/menaquinone biosynthesis C-methylase UbiE
MASTSPANPNLPPNHHGSYPRFDGLRGLVAALVFTVGRRADAELAVALTGAGAGDDVVDVGCGPGAAVRLAAARGASSVTGVDPAAVMLRFGRTLTRPGHATTVRYQEGTAEALPLPDGSATVVWSLATVHHWRDLDAGLQEVRRVLRPSGRFLVLERRTEPDASGPASHGWSEDQAQQFAQQCCAAGFSGVEIGRHPQRRRSLLSVLSVRAQDA